MSALGRMVRVGFAFVSGSDCDGEVDEGVMEDRRRGHSIIAFASVLRRMGR